MPPPTHIVTMPYFDVAALHFLQDGGGQFGAGATQRMPKGDGAAVDVDLRRVEPELLHHGKRLRRERLVQLDQVDLVERQAGEFQRFRNGINRSDPHLFRQAPGVGESDKTRQRMNARAPVARSSDITTAAAAPSDVCDEFPAVTVPLGVECRLSASPALPAKCPRGGLRPP